MADVIALPSLRADQIPASAVTMRQLAEKRKADLITGLRLLLTEAENGRLSGLVGEVRNHRGETFLVQCGDYSDGELSAAGFRMQMMAAFTHGA